MEACSDRALHELVRQHLMRDQRLAGQSLEITSYEGDIEIIGTVDTEEHKQLALELARGFVGVCCVADHIEVRESASSD